jgi:rhomboid protease GluP
MGGTKINCCEASHMNQKKKAILCPNCKSLISRDEARCPHCGLGHPGSWWKNNKWTQGFRETDQLLKIIIYTNVGLYILSLFLNIRGVSLSLNPLSMLAPDDRSLLLLGATGTYPINTSGRWWTLVSANYLHGGILHIFFNMFVLRQIGYLVDEEYGTYRMFIIYTIGGIFGFLVSYLVGIPFTYGASAAVMSLIGATLYYGKSRGGSYGQFVYRQVVGWVVAIFVFGFLVPGINNWGHAGGLVAGAILGYFLGYKERRRENIWHKLLAGLCALVTVAVLGYAIAFGIYWHLAG